VADPLPNVFEAAGKLEFRDENYDRAIEALGALTGQPAARPEALLRIARLERRLNRPKSALAVYYRMYRETPDGVPYALLAAGARCELTSGAEATESLRTALIAGRWPIPRETFEYYWALANRLQHKADDPPKQALEFASLIARLYDEWQRAVQTVSNYNGRETQADASLVIWHASPERLTALFAPAGWLGASMKLPANAGDIRWRLLRNASPAPESKADAEPHVLRSLADAQLAGKLEFSGAAPVSNGGLTRALCTRTVRHSGEYFIAFSRRIARRSASSSGLDTRLLRTEAQFYLEAWLFGVALMLKRNGAGRFSRISFPPFRTNGSRRFTARNITSHSRTLCSGSGGLSSIRRPPALLSTELGGFR
jgi:hypothetical protein